MSDPAKSLRELALRYPEAQEGVSCAGTALEKPTVMVRNKAFLFLGKADVMVKLRDSLADAARLAEKEPGRYKAGAHGWVTVTFSDGKAPPLELLEKWIDESYRAIANKPTAKKTAARKTAAKKTAASR
jgi:predicted DNA-binding protein (MmcQ/YjbR family)